MRVRARLWHLAAALSIVATANAAFADSDADVARDELQRGYELRKQDKCADALPLLLDSQRRVPQLKTLINIADCEERVGEWVASRRDWQQALSLASNAGDSAIGEEARKRADALAARIPMLSLKLTADVPPNARVWLDERVLGAADWASAIALDPGTHVVVVRAVDHADAKVELALHEGEHRELALHAGASTRVEPVRKSNATLQVAGFTAIGVGAVAIGLGSYFGVAAINEKNAANCPENRCGVGSDPSSLRSALQSAHASTALLITGAALGAGGVVLLVVGGGGGEKDKRVESQLRLGPSGLSLSTRF